MIQRLEKDYSERQKSQGQLLPGLVKATICLQILLLLERQYFLQCEQRLNGYNAKKMFRFLQINTSESLLPYIFSDNLLLNIKKRLIFEI